MSYAFVISIGGLIAMSVVLSDIGGVIAHVEDIRLECEKRLLCPNDVGEQYEPITSLIKVIICVMGPLMLLSGSHLIPWNPLRCWEVTVSLSIVSCLVVVGCGITVSERLQILMSFVGGAETPLASVGYPRTIPRDTSHSLSRISSTVISVTGLSAVALPILLTPLCAHTRKERLNPVAV